MSLQWVYEIAYKWRMMLRSAASNFVSTVLFGRKLDSIGEFIS